MVGAGAGIGGNGGAGGNGAGWPLFEKAMNYSIRAKNNGIDGESGENCGIINISNSIEVWAYGGGGGSGGAGTNSTGGGGGGYPAAGIGGRRSWPEAGGEHADGAGGFSGGSSSDGAPHETEWIGVNGCASQQAPYLSIAYSSSRTWHNHNDDGTLISHTYNGITCYAGPACGGGYYTQGGGASVAVSHLGSVGGQGVDWGCQACGTQYVGCKSGDGGNAGEGGKITSSEKAKLYAFNGNVCTDGDYNNIYRYICTRVTNSTSKTEKTNEKLSIQTQKNGEKFIPTFIFAQNGQYRETYTSNFWQFEIDKIKTGIDKSKIHLMGDNENNSEIRGIQATNYREEYWGAGQGIGSGAGYLELSNGTYTIDSSLN